MIVYILIGVVFMFLLEHFTSLNIFKKYTDVYPKAYLELRMKERIMGILLWPILAVIFIFTFFKTLFK